MGERETESLLESSCIRRRKLLWLLEMSPAYFHFTTFWESEERDDLWHKIFLQIPEQKGDRILHLLCLRASWNIISNKITTFMYTFMIWSSVSVREPKKNTTPNTHPYCTLEKNLESNCTWWNSSLQSSVTPAIVMVVMAVVVVVIMVEVLQLLLMRKYWYKS
jgi:hypothetical protein